MIPTTAPVFIIACGALAREIVCLKKINNWHHMVIKCLPAKYHNTPEKIAPSVENTIQNIKKSYQDPQIFVAYGDCGTGGLLDKVLDKENVPRIKGPHCYAFFHGNWVKEQENITTFYLTDFMIRHFDSFIKKPLGLDRHPELKDVYFNHYERVLYLAQEKNTDLQQKAKKIGQDLGLRYDECFTGYGDMASFLKEAA